MKQDIHSSDAPEAVGPYSQAIQAGQWIFCSGQVPLNSKTGQLVEGDIAAQTHQVMKNLQAVLHAANSDFKYVVKSTIYLRDLKNFSKVNEVYASYLTKPYPARATIEVAALPLNAEVEIEMIAFTG